MNQDLVVAIIQSDLIWENVNKNIEAFDQKIHAINMAIDLVVLPEMFSTGFTMRPQNNFEDMDGETVSWMKKIAIEKQCAITGSLIIKEAGNFYNRLLWVDAKGEIQYYDKKHLFTLAEEHLHYTKGASKIIVELKQWKIRPAICYDLRFPVWLRNEYKEDEQYDYDLLIVVANWPQKRSNAWKCLLQARAIENQAYVIGVNRVGEDGQHHIYNGDSAVFDSLGETIYLKSMIEDVAIVSLNKESLTAVRKHLPFLKDADSSKMS